MIKKQRKKTYSTGHDSDIALRNQNGSEQTF